MPAGQPTKYKQEYCEIVINEMSEGASICEVCGIIGICYQTFYNWCDSHTEFLEAKKRGEQLSEMWWQTKGRKNLENKNFNYVGWYMNMKNRFGWRDKQEVEHSGEVGVKCNIILAGDSDTSGE